MAGAERGGREQGAGEEEEEKVKYLKEARDVVALRNPQLYILNPPTYTLIPQAYTLNPQPYILNPKFEIRNPISDTLCPEPCHIINSNPYPTS